MARVVLQSKEKVDCHTKCRAKALPINHIQSPGKAGIHHAKGRRCLSEPIYLFLQHF